MTEAKRARTQATVVETTPVEPPQFKGWRETITCPLSKEIFQFPVLTPDGLVYERASIEEYIKEKKCFPPPSTQGKATSKTLSPAIHIEGILNSIIAGHVGDPELQKVVRLARAHRMFVQGDMKASAEYGLPKAMAAYADSLFKQGKSSEAAGWAERAKAAGDLFGLFLFESYRWSSSSPMVYPEGVIESFKKIALSIAAGATEDVAPNDYRLQSAFICGDYYDKCKQHVSALQFYRIGANGGDRNCIRLCADLMFEMNLVAEAFPLLIKVTQNQQYSVEIRATAHLKIGKTLFLGAPPIVRDRAAAIKHFEIAERLNSSKAAELMLSFSNHVRAFDVKSAQPVAPRKAAAIAEAGPAAVPPQASRTISAADAADAVAATPAASETLPTVAQAIASPYLSAIV